MPGIERKPRSLWFIWDRNREAGLRTYATTSLVVQMRLNFRRIDSTSSKLRDQNPSALRITWFGFAISHSFTIFSQRELEYLRISSGEEFSKNRCAAAVWVFIRVGIIRACLFWNPVLGYNIPFFLSLFLLDTKADCRAVVPAHFSALNF